MIEKDDSAASHPTPAAAVRGSVMVVGAGIAGMQSALDLADGGFKVYLVEKETSIGGRMAQLDKTFPTNDCAMCTISPRLSDVARHDNIEILTGAELTDLSGAAGDFNATLHMKPRYVDVATCNACGECVEVCPVFTAAEFEHGSAQRTAIHRRFPQAIPSSFAISKNDLAPCRAGCPAGVNAHGYVSLVSVGKFKEAYDLVAQRCPLPSVCGRICDRPCEGQCNRAQVDQAVAVGNLKRFIADYVYEHRDQYATTADSPPESNDGREGKIAVIGGGPGGLTAAGDLSRLGYQVTIFEAMDYLGGMLRAGVPEFRLPREQLDFDIQHVLNDHIEVRLGTRLGTDFTLDDLTEQGYQSVFVSTGAHKGRSLNIDGAGAEGVLNGLEFLRNAGAGQPTPAGRRTLVVGGGNVAMDAARTALRVGAEQVTILYRRGRDEMPALAEEIHQAQAEGVQFDLLTNPARIITGTDGAVSAVECVRMELGEPDDSGRRRPVEIPGSNFTIDADTIILAIGQSADLTGMPFGDGDRIEADDTLATSIPGVFAGGDAVLGPATVVEAMGHGHRAAEAIDLYVRGESTDRVAEAARLTPTLAPNPDPDAPRLARTELPQADPAARIADFREVESGYTAEQAIAEAKRCLHCGGCCECMECLKVCSPGAIKHTEVAHDEQHNVGAVILAAGYEPFDPAAAGLYLAGEAPNVVTNLQFERMCSASGPTGGDLCRPSDDAQPKRIAWIQCVGSRDVTCERDYCSGFCCMASIKEAVMTRDHYNDCETTIFYNDIRAHGKGFEKYYARARDASGVEFVKSLPARITEHTRTGNLLVHYGLEDGTVDAREFDMVVLATGMSITDSARQLAAAAGVQTDPFGFCHGDPTRPNSTSRSGVFVAGALERPCDIPESVVGGSASAAAAMEMLVAARGTEVQDRQFPAERDVTGEEPRIGVFVCRCGTNIARVVDVPSLAQYAGTLPNVIHAEENLYSCSTDMQKHMIEMIGEHNLNRVVVSSCTPRTHEPLFREVLREAGLNPYLFEMANIRDQCSWVHESTPEAANDKARALLRMAVGRAAELEPIAERATDVTCNALVLGGGAAGMTAAANLSGQGFSVVLLEREAELGGQLRVVRGTIDGVDARQLLTELTGRVESDPKITVLTQSEAISCEGHIGQYRTVVRDAGGDERTIEHAVMIAATGGREHRGGEYGLDEHPRVCTQRDLQAKLDEQTDLGDTVVMIQCVGSRDDAHPYCSRVCCNQAVTNALAIVAASPGTRVYVLHRGMRTYGLGELQYRKAREAGVIFVRFDDDDAPDVDLTADKPHLTVRDPAVGHEFDLRPDWLVLSAGIEADPSTAELTKTFKTPVDEDGFLLEAHIKLRPVDFANEGMYLCGLAHSPKTLGESMAQALAAAGRAARVLSKEHLPLSGYTAEVDTDLCAACLTCVRMCPYNVPRMDDELHAVQIDAASCHGCGSCAAACPVRAIQVGHYKPRQIIAALEELRRGD